jgi:hypothetical protein
MSIQLQIWRFVISINVIHTVQVKTKAIVLLISDQTTPFERTVVGLVATG